MKTCSDVMDNPRTRKGRDGVALLIGVGASGLLNNQKESVGRLRPKFTALRFARVGDNGLSCSTVRTSSSTHHQDRARRNEEYNLYKSNHRPQLTPLFSISSAPKYRHQQRTAYGPRNMSSFTQPMPVVACGRIPAMGKSISHHLLPEYEGS